MKLVRKILLTIICTLMLIGNVNFIAYADTEDSIDESTINNETTDIIEEETEEPIQEEVTLDISQELADILDLISYLPSEKEITTIDSIDVIKSYKEMINDIKLKAADSLIDDELVFYTENYIDTNYFTDLTNQLNARMVELRNKPATGAAITDKGFYNNYYLLDYIYNSSNDNKTDVKLTFSEGIYYDYLNIDYKFSIPSEGATSSRPGLYYFLANSELTWGYSTGSGERWGFLYDFGNKRLWYDNYRTISSKGTDYSVYASGINTGHVFEVKAYNYGTNKCYKITDESGTTISTTPATVSSDNQQKLKGVFITPTGTWPSRFYYLKVYNKTTLQHHYVPVLKKNGSQRTGIYDLINGTFTETHEGGKSTAYAGSYKQAQYNAKIQYTLTVNKTTGISSTTPSSSQTVYAGNPISISASVSTGYHFTGWTGGFTSSTNSTSVYMDSNKTITANAALNTYSVKYNGNGSTSGSMSNSSHTYGTANNLTANAFSRAYTVTYNANGGTCPTSSNTANYAFAGWATSDSGSVVYFDKQSVANLTSTNNGTYNLYAKWNSASVTLPTPTRTGYTFTGWYTQETGGTKVGNAGASYTPTAATTLYAHWINENRSVTYISSVDQLTDRTLVSGIYVLTNDLTFNGDDVDTYGLKIAGDVYLYVPNGITLTANGKNSTGQIGGGAGIYLPESSTLYIVGKGTVNATGGNAGNGTNGNNGSDGKMFKDAKTYYGGNGGSGGAGGGGAGAGIGTNGANGGSGGAGGIGEGGAINNDHCTGITGGKNGEDGYTALPMGDIYVEDSINLTATGGSASNTSGNGGSAGYSVYDEGTYWSKNHTAGGGAGGAGGGSGYAASDIGTGGAGGGGGAGGSGGYSLYKTSDGYYYAHSNGGLGGYGYVNGINGNGQNSKTLKVWNGTKTITTQNSDYNYTAPKAATGGFAGTNTVKTNIQKLDSTDARLKTTITFDTQGGSNANPSSIDVYMGYTGEGSNDGISIPVPTRDGYSFDGYYTQTEGKGNKVYNASGLLVNPDGKTSLDGKWIQIVNDGNVVQELTLYAKWTINNYIVTLDSQGGTGGSSSVIATYNASMPEITLPSRAGYSFDGYYDAVSGGTQYYSSTGESLRNFDKTSNTTLYAHWIENTATLTYNANGHGTAPSAVTMKYSEATNLASALSATGYTFNGWNTKADGTGTTYTAGSQYKAVNVNPTAITLYAKWTVNAYSVTLNANGGEGGSSSVTATYNATNNFTYKRRLFF